MRLFVALPLPEAVRVPLARRAAELRPELPAARWVPASNLHLTLVFLGEIEPGRRPALERALAPCFAGTPPLGLRLSGGGCFPPRRPARVAWVGLEPAPALARLQPAVAAAVAGSLERPPESRPYHAHLTLARCRRPWPRRAVERWERAFAGPQGPAFEVEAGHLMLSRLGPGGARYESVAAFALGGVEEAPL